MTPGEPAGPTQRVWSVAVRLGHWALAASVLIGLILHEGGPWHERLGYAALAIATWRVGYGLLTRDRFARFAYFVRGPRATLGYAAALAAKTEPHHTGHNPLGGWMILALLTAVLLAGASGALFTTDRFWGDETVLLLHSIAGWSLALLVPLHLAGVVFTSWRQRENLVKAMVTGRKAMDHSSRAPELPHQPHQPH
jgi:cytochrome b